MHATATGGNYGQYGDRIPAVWFYPNTTRLHVVAGHGGEGEDTVAYQSYNDECPITEQLEIGTTTRVKIVMKSTQVRVFYNGTLKCAEARVDRSIFSNATIYAADPWHAAADGLISNLYFKRLTGTPSHVFVGDLNPVSPVRATPGMPGWRVSLPLNYEIGLEITPRYAEWRLSHGDWNSYCVTEEGGSIEPAYTELGMGLNETACLHAADAGGFGFANSWSSDGRCRGLAACPYEFNCTARGCSTYDSGAKSYTRGLSPLWQNIVHFTATDHDMGNQGDRIPGVWFYPSTRRLHIIDGHGANANDECAILDELPAGVRQLRHHFGPSLWVVWALYHPTHAVHCALLGCHAYWMLIGACDPML